MSDIRTILTARLAVARITGGKIDAILRRVGEDSRLRGILCYHGAHTGRWAGRGFQPQNLPRPKGALPEDVWDSPEDAPAVAAEWGEDTATVLGSMLRGVIVPPPGESLAVVDYSSIEARVLLWLAGDEEGLQIYRDGKDAYKALAAPLFGIPYDDVTKEQRTFGKVMALACGYQGGPVALARTANTHGLDLAGAGLMAADVVDAWRDANVKVAGERKGIWKTPEGRTVVTRRGGLWRDLKAAAWDATQHVGNCSAAGRCLWFHDGGHLVCTLPSGRPVVYRNARIEEVDTRWDTRARALTYEHPRMGRISTYGGKLAENVTQAVARDLMGEALVELEAAGVRVVLHVHDEIIAEGDAATIGAVRRAMLRVPPWAAGLPIAVEGNLMERYGK